MAFTTISLFSSPARLVIFQLEMEVKTKNSVKTTIRLFYSIQYWNQLNLPAAVCPVFLVVAVTNSNIELQILHVSTLFCLQVDFSSIIDYAKQIIKDNNFEGGKHFC